MPSRLQSPDHPQFLPAKFNAQFNWFIFGGNKYSDFEYFSISQYIFNINLIFYPNKIWVANLPQSLKTDEISD